MGRLLCASCRYICYLEAKHYSGEVIKEFDSLDELRAFDEHYLMHTNSTILLNICNTLNVTPAEIINIKPIKDGLTNTSFCFDSKEKRMYIVTQVKGHKSILTASAKPHR